MFVPIELGIELIAEEERSTFPATGESSELGPARLCILPVRKEPGSFRWSISERVEVQAVGCVVAPREHNHTVPQHCVTVEGLALLQEGNGLYPPTVCGASYRRPVHIHPAVYDGICSENDGLSVGRPRDVVRLDGVRGIDP